MSDLCSFLDNPLIPYLLCLSCKTIMTNPVRMHPCGHTFCQDCSQNIQSVCGYCNRLIQVKQPDLTAINLISDLQVKCNNPDCPYLEIIEIVVLQAQKEALKLGKIPFRKVFRNTILPVSQKREKNTIELKQDPSSILRESTQIIALQALDKKQTDNNNSFKGEETFIECIEIGQERPYKETKEKVIQL